MKFCLTRFLQLFSFLLICGLTACTGKKGPTKVLLFTKTEGYRHSSIEVGKASILQLGKEHGFIVDTTENAETFNEDNLRQYAAVIFLHTTGDLFNHIQEADFRRYIQAGRGYVGVHAASDAEYGWGWYNRLVGGYFASHPAIQEAKLEVSSHAHPSTAHLTSPWVRTDEWYNFKKRYDKVNVLLRLDESSYKGGENGKDHPIAWYHEYDGGRAWYTGLGHTEASFSEPDFLKHLLEGIKYAIGSDEAYKEQAITQPRAIEENRFTKTMLVEGNMVEPTEMTLLPNFDILVAERRGRLLLYKNEDQSFSTVGQLDVYWKTDVKDVNAEEGLMGIEAAPDFAQSKWVYIFYSPADTSVNRLSRFTFDGDSIVMASEKVILQFYSQRDICCHTGGSIAFSGDGQYLYLSSGDNATPFDEPNESYPNKGFAPLDDRPGHKQYDARRSSGNTNDLRGKIMRIKVHPDGSYTIPEGNLFPPGTPKTRPEIYVMGNRNPYRISVDKKNGNLYWGEVGPDSNRDSLDKRGPQGYDEVNQARQAGFFGWPLFVGNNYAYFDYNYNTGRSTKAYDPEKPVNVSRNNTGLVDLPPAQPAFIWYPYDESPDFPQVGTGGRNAMAGPVYYSDLHTQATRLPDYYNGKLFIYDWMRNWIKVVTMQPNGNFDKMEPFMDKTTFASVIDMEMGSDGRLYLLEYGNGWFSKNEDSGLSRIDYNGGNRPPEVEAMTVDRSSGKLPLTIKASIKATDPEGDKVNYRWTIGTEEVETKEPHLEYTIQSAGDYPVFCELIDRKGASVKTGPTVVYAGNEAPKVEVKVAGNQHFYFPNHAVAYEVKVNDENDFAVKNLFVSAEFHGKSQKQLGHLAASGINAGEKIIASLDCQSCHKKVEKSIGPSYQAIAEKYKDDNDAETYLIEKIIQGGGGVWGETMMAAHPTVPKEEVRQMVVWIRSLAKEEEEKASLAAIGEYEVTEDERSQWNNVLYLRASYTDNPTEGIKPLTSTQSAVLHSNTINLRNIDEREGYLKTYIGKGELLGCPKGTAWLRLDAIDLTDVKQLKILTAWSEKVKGDYQFELRLGSKEGKVVARMESKEASRSRKKKKQYLTATLLEPVNSTQDVYLISKGPGGEGRGDLMVYWFAFER